MEYIFNRKHWRRNVKRKPGTKMPVSHKTISINEEGKKNIVGTRNILIITDERQLSGYET